MLAAEYNEPPDDDSPGWGGVINLERLRKVPAAQEAARPLRANNDDNEPEEVIRLSAKELMRREFKRPRQIVEGLFPAGCVLLVGPPKQGKSWMSLQLARCIDAGVPFMGRETVQGDVLYLALEDGFNRLQDRLGKQEVRGAEEFTECLDFQIQVETADKGGLQVIEEWIQNRPDAAMVIVDVLKMFRQPRGGKVDPYERDYGDIRPLTALANKYGVCIIVVHHTNKGSASAADPFDRVSGTGGLSGAADGTVLLVPDESGNLGLYGRGRDFPEFEVSVAFNPELCIWEIAEKSEVGGYGDLSNKILDRLRQENGNAIGPLNLAYLIDANPTEVSKRLATLTKARRVSKVGRGQYVLAGLEPKAK
ncbi:AAA family ATPase [Agrobacterium tumefaciens]|nr:AAA family ATPase [Agrobacterium tumefaciens]